MLYLFYIDIYVTLGYWLRGVNTAISLPFTREIRKSTRRGEYNDFIGTRSSRAFSARGLRQMQRRNTV